MKPSVALACSWSSEATSELKDVSPVRCAYSMRAFQVEGGTQEEYGLGLLGSGKVGVEEKVVL